MIARGCRGGGENCGICRVHYKSKTDTFNCRWNYFPQSNRKVSLSNSKFKVTDVDGGSESDNNILIVSKRQTPNFLCCRGITAG